jgi:hypothetical protein
VDAPPPPYFFCGKCRRARPLRVEIRSRPWQCGEQFWRNFVKNIFRVGVLTAIALTACASATFVARTASASPSPAFPGSVKNKNKNRNTNEHTKEMRKHQKKLILKGRHEKHREKHT